MHYMHSENFYSLNQITAVFKIADINLNKMLILSKCIDVETTNAGNAL